MTKNIVTYEPLNFVNELNTLMENIWQRSVTGDETKIATCRWIPAVDIREEPDQFILQADLPGVDVKNIDISMENNVLTVKGKREELKKEEKSNYYRVERTRGEFYRRFTLPDTADGDRINAKSKQGVLEIIIPKKQKSDVRKINIETEG